MTSANHNGVHLDLTQLWVGPRRGAEEAREECQTTDYHESVGVEAIGIAAGVRDGLELLRRIRRAGSDQRALEAIRESLP